MKSKCVVGGLFSVLGFASLIASFALPIVSVLNVSSVNFYSYLTNLSSLSENKQVFIAMILFIAAAALLLFCSITAILCLAKGQGSRSVFFTRVMAFFALVCCVVSAVLFGISNEGMVGAGVILPVVCAFVAFAGALIMPSDKEN